MHQFLPLAKALLLENSFMYSSFTYCHPELPCLFGEWSQPKLLNIDPKAGGFDFSPQRAGCLPGLCREKSQSPNYFPGLGVANVAND